jgi:hypothetical protein
MYLNNLQTIINYPSPSKIFIRRYDLEKYNDSFIFIIGSVKGNCCYCNPVDWSGNQQSSLKQPNYKKQKDYSRK